MKLFILGFGLKTTAMQFGYFFALLFCILFLVRGFREDRLSDKLLGAVMFFLAMDLQDYTFGFAGINVLWEDLYGLPRHFPWIYPASVYFYFKAQTNVEFKFKWSDIWHIVPYLIYLVVTLVVYCLDRETVYMLEQTIIGKAWIIAMELLPYVGLIFYFTKCILMYREYKQWTLAQYSNIDPISFVWLRNFVYIFIICTVLRIIFRVIDMFQSLGFDHDYYWQLSTVAIAIYVGIAGYTQSQDRLLFFGGKEEDDVQDTTTAVTDTIETRPAVSELSEDTVQTWTKKIDKAMKEDKVFLEPELSLSDLAKTLKTNTSLLSSVINQVYKKNFNDFINEHRVNEFKSNLTDKANASLTLIAIAYDSGFNSKATFNRAVKKITGLSPKELADSVQ